MSNNKSFFKLGSEVDNEGSVKVLLQLDTELIRKGALRVLTPSQLKVLLAIASHMDENGEAYPSMRCLSEITGISTNTVNTAIIGLLDVRVDGVPIVKRKIEGTGARKKSRYSFIVDNDWDVEEVEMAGITRVSPKVMLLFFCEEFEKEFKAQYRPNWGRDIKQIKSLMEKFEDDEDVKEVIHVAITEYRNRWASPSYPTPTVGAVCGWIGNNVIEILQGRHERKQGTSSKYDYKVDEGFTLD